MRRPAFRRTVKGRETSQQSSIPAPIGGWNTRQNLAEMEDIYAVAVDNLFGETTDVRVRKGWANHVTGIGQQVESLMPHNEQDGTQTLFCAANDSFYNVTSAGAVGAAVQGSLTNARWQHVNFTNSAGTSYLCCFNGTDGPRYYDGTSWTTITGVSTPAITGVTATSIINAFVFKRRMYLILNNSLSLYYLPIDSVGGAAKRTRLDGYFSKGGYIVAGETWTLDGGDGVDDFMVLISSEGQVAVFEGTNPSSSSTWSLKGIWNVGEPIGHRCMIKYGGDVLILTVQGVFPLSRALQTSGEAGVDPASALTFNINYSMTEAALNYKANYGWNMTLFPQGNQLLLNVPVVENSSQEQFVMNTITNSWWRFTDIGANCWATFNEELYYGGNGIVGKFGGSVYADNGEDIQTDLKQAFSYLGARGRLKYVTAMRPNFLANGTPTVSMGVAVDYGDEQPQTTLSFTPNTAGTWDAATWDSGFWGGDVSPYNDWQTVGAVGTALSLRMKTVSNGIDVRYTSTDTVFQYGGVIG